MKIRERLKAAYENVAVDGDRTWAAESKNDAFRKANQKVYSREHRLSGIKIIEERPRTVKDIIPQSKLAVYGDYEYNEARELCYTRCPEPKPRFERLATRDAQRDESWLLAEVDELFVWFLHCTNRTRLDYGPFEACDDADVTDGVEDDEDVEIESPFLAASGFKEKKLKMSIVSDKVKQIWNGGKTRQSEGACRSYVVFASGGHRDDAAAAADASESFDHLKELPVSFKEQSAWFAKRVDDKAKQLSSRRLYSAVLQGLQDAAEAGEDAPQPPPKSDKPRLASRTAAIQTTPKAAASATPKSRPAYPLQYSVATYAQFNYFQQGCACAIANRFQRHLAPPAVQYAQPAVLMLQQRSAAVYPVQPPYYFQPVAPPRVQPRWIVPQAYRPPFPAHWVAPKARQRRAVAAPPPPQPPAVSILKKARSDSSTTASPRTQSASSRGGPRRTRTAARPLPKVYLDELASKTVNLLFEEDVMHVPVTCSVSEELEIEALAQYCSSTDNVYQELERQAAEQYVATFSENWTGPPTAEAALGGPQPCCVECRLVCVHV